MRRMNGVVKSPLRIGWESAKANALPIAVLWTVGLLLVVGYYHVPNVTSVLGPLARWQTVHGAIGAFLNRIVTCGILPGVFLLAMPSIRPALPWTTIAVETVWFGLQSILVLRFYELQSLWFGGGNDALTVLAKTLVDQFAWTVFVIAPVNSFFFSWLGHGFSLRWMKDMRFRTWISAVYLPNLVMNWCVWIPTVVAVYAFPLALQTHVAGLIGAIWTLLCLHLGSRAGR